MITAAKIYFLIFGALTILGGVIGFVNKGSVASIVAGSVAGLLLLLAGWLMPTNTTAGLVLGLVTALLLAGRFTPLFIKSASFMPAGMMSILSLIGVVVAIAAWIKR